MNSREPEFSVVVPTFKRPAPLTACLHALARLDYPRDLFEVIVVDDGGGVPGDVIGSIREKINLTVVTQSNAGPATSRNTGAGKATRQYLAFTDDDCRPEPAWLRNLAVWFAKSPDGLIGGRTLNALSANPFAAASQLLIDYLYAHYTTASGNPMFFTTSNMAVSAARFRSLGGFDTTFKKAAGEDREFCARWRAAGFEMSYASDCVVNHAHHMSWHGFLRQHFNYGRSAFHYRRRRLQTSHERIPLEPFGFYWGMIRFSFVTSSIGSRRWFVTCLMCMSQVANALGFFVERLRGSTAEGAV
jgi:GT2 family glycosyltransferase